MSTTIYIVATNYKNQHGTQAWFWDRDEAAGVYTRRIEEIGDTHGVKLYRLDVNDALDEIIAEAISNDSAEVLTSHDPDTDGAWEGPRTSSTSGELYLEYTEGGEYWAFTVSKPLNDWRVFSMGQRVGTVALETNLFPTYFARDEKNVLIGTFVDFAEALKAVAAKSAGLPIK